MKERSEHASRLPFLSDCVPPVKIVHTLAEEYGVSPQAARACKRGKQLITDSLDQSDAEVLLLKDHAQLRGRS